LDVRETTTKPVLAWLRREARKGMRVGGICTGTHALARAGLLEDKSCTIHWENRDSFSEEFPEIDLSQSIFVIDRNRFTAAGGTAPTDMMLKMIAEDHGAEIASKVADQLIYTAIRTEQDEQRLSILTRIGVRHPKLAAVIKLMEEKGLIHMRKIVHDLISVKQCIDRLQALDLRPVQRNQQRPDHN
jgi:transcriptional regulator GlxA family with amidase domain